MEIIKNISNKKIEYIKDQINLIPLITTNSFEKTIFIKKIKFNIDSFINKGASKQIFLLKKNNKEIIYRCPLIRLNNDTLIINNYIENFIHSFLSDLNRDKILKLFQLGYNSEYNFIASFIEKMDGTLYGFLKKEDVDLKLKLKILLNELYEIANLLLKLQKEIKFVHNDLKCDNIFYKNDKFYLGDFDKTRIEINKQIITCDNTNFNRKKDLFILTQSLYFSFNIDLFREKLFNYFPIKTNIKTVSDFHALYKYNEESIDDIYLPENYINLLKKLI